MGTSYQNLVAWQKAMDLVTDVYKVTGAFPREELYGLTSQLRRAAVSVPSNIAGGQGRKRDLKPDLGQTLLYETGELGRILNGLIKSLA